MPHTVSIPDVPYLRIATEEAFAPKELFDEYRALIEKGSIDDPGFMASWGSALSNRRGGSPVVDRLMDLGEQRIAHMDRAGIARQIIALTAPGTQIFPSDAAASMARLANDILHDACTTYPDRFTGLTAVAPQNPSFSVEEIRRGIDLGFKGIIVNSHTQHRYLDDPEFFPLLEAAEALDQPIYIHPNTPSKGLIEPMVDLGLHAAIFGFGVEVGLHVLRMIVSGVFDRFPKLKIVIGHLGEALPYWIYRLDYAYTFTQNGRYDNLPQLELTPSEYLRRNVWITTSGMAHEPAIMYAREVLGADRVLYAMDYPYQYDLNEVIIHDNLPLSVAEKTELYQTNAERLFKLV